MQADIVASFVMTLDEIRTARPLVASRLNLPQTVAVLVIVLGLSPVVLGILTNRIAVDVADFMSWKSIVLVASFVLLYLFFRYQQGVAFRQAFAQNPASNKRLEYGFSEDGIQANVVGVSETRFPWSAFEKIRRTPKGFLLYQTQQIVIWIPNHAFRSVQDADAVAVMAQRLARKFIME